MTLFTEQDEYIGIYGKVSGAWVSILPQGILAFPDDEGITVKPGTATSIALKEVCEMYYIRNVPRRNFVNTEFLV
jgi:hypothetical protein